MEEFIDLFQAAKQSDDDPCQLELFGLAGSDRVITKDKQVTPLDGFVTDDDRADEFITRINKLQWELPFDAGRTMSFYAWLSPNDSVGSGMALE